MREREEKAECLFRDILSVSGVEAGGRDCGGGVVNVKRKQEDKRREVKIVVLFLILTVFEQQKKKIIIKSSLICGVNGESCDGRERCDSSVRTTTLTSVLCNVDSHYRTAAFDLTSKRLSWPFILVFVFLQILTH